MGRITRCAILPAIATAALLAAAPVHADDASYLKYLNDHGYTAYYTDGQPIAPVSTRVLGHMICEDLHVGRTVAQLQPNYPQWPQFPLMADAAQHELCP